MGDCAAAIVKRLGIGGSMRPRTKQCAELVRTKPGITRAEIAAAMGCANATAGQHLYDARCEGLIKPSGVGRYSGWHPAGSGTAVASVAGGVSSVWALAGVV